MHSAILAALILSVVLPNGSWALPSGAPEAACGTISPSHFGIPSQDVASSPYTLDITTFDGTYTPGETYILTLSGTVDFRGLLVQARTVADNSPVGSFTPVAGLTRRSCTVAGEQTAITHTNRDDKSSVQLEFTAPAAGTGPIRFLFAVVQIFVNFYAPAETAIIVEDIVEEAPVDLSFTGDTPLVIGNDIFVNISVSPARPLRCELVTRGEPGNPIISRVEDCSSGFITFFNVPSGEHRVRVIAGDRDAVVRSRVVHMPDDPFFCSLNAINNGVTRHYFSNGTLRSYTIEFNPIGFNAGFLCQLDYTININPCNSPFVVAAQDVEFRVKVIPEPRSCPGNRRPLVFKLQ